MEAHFIFFSVFEGPAASAFGIEESLVSFVLPKAISDHLFNRLRSGQIFLQWQFANEIDIVSCLYAEADGPYDGAQTERALGVDRWFAQAPRIAASLKSAADGLVTLDGVSVFVWRYVDVAGDTLKDLRILAYVNGHMSHLVCFE